MATRPWARSAPIVVALAAAVALALAGGCTSDTDGAAPGENGAVGTTGEAPTATDDGAVETTTTTAPPMLLGLAPNLALGQGQCYAELPPEPDPDDTTTTSTVAGETTVPATPTVPAEPTVPPTLAESTTTTPRPTNVALVDCAGSHDGAVYATFCLGPRPEIDNDLTAMACPGELELDYPGDRTIRRAATRVCLQRFEEVFGEAYGISARIAEEFVPTEPLWNIGDRRVVCVASEPSE
jgi:hypothetical protein